jgi:hypothetical protein
LLTGVAEDRRFCNPRVRRHRRKKNQNTNKTQLLIFKKGLKITVFLGVLVAAALSSSNFLGFITRPDRLVVVGVLSSLGVEVTAGVAGVAGVNAAAATAFAPDILASLAGAAAVGVMVGVDAAAFALTLASLAGGAGDSSAFLLDPFLVLTIGAGA